MFTKKNNDNDNNSLKHAARMVSDCMDKIRTLEIKACELQSLINIHKEKLTTIYITEREFEGKINRMKDEFDDKINAILEYQGLEMRKQTPAPRFVVKKKKDNR